MMHWSIYAYFYISPDLFWSKHSTVLLESISKSYIKLLNNYSSCEKPGFSYSKRSNAFTDLSSIKT